jgi:hypothetical protein
MLNKAILNLIAMIVVLKTCSFGSTIIGQDTFQIGDHWLYTEDTSAGCCAFIPPMHYDIFSGSHRILIVDRFVKSDSLFYVCQDSDSGLSFGITKSSNGGLDSIRDSSITNSHSIDTLYNTPFDSFYYSIFSDIQHVIQYQGKTLILETNGNILFAVTTGTFAYLQKTGFLESSSSLLNKEWTWQKSFNLVSYNDVPIDTSLIYSLGSLSHLGVKRGVLSSIAVRLDPTSVTFASIDKANSMHISVFDTRGRLAESGFCRNANTFHFGNRMNPGVYIVRLLNTGIDYSTTCILGK